MKDYKTSFNNSFVKKGGNDQKDEYSFFKEKSGYDQNFDYGNQKFNYYNTATNNRYKNNTNYYNIQPNHAYANYNNYDDYHNPYQNNYQNNYQNQFQNNNNQNNQNYYNNNNFYDNNANVSNFNDASYYSYNNDSNVSFKKKNFKTKHLNISTTINKLEQVNNKLLNIEEEVNKAENESHENEVEILGKDLNNVIINNNINAEPQHNIREWKKVAPQLNIQTNNEEIENFEKKKEEQCVLEYLKYVNEKYPNLVKINDVNRSITKYCQTQMAPRFFIIKSFTEEDIHKVSQTPFIYINFKFAIVYQI